MTTLHGFKSVLGRALDTFWGLSQFHDLGIWFVCEVALTHTDNTMRSKCLRCVDRNGTKGKVVREARLHLLNTIHSVDNGGLVDHVKQEKVS